MTFLRRLTFRAAPRGPRLPRQAGGHPLPSNRTEQEQ